MEVPEVKRLKSLEEDNARLKKLLAEAMLDKEALQVALGKVLTTDQKREAVALMFDATGLSQRLACRLTGLSLSTCSYEAQRPAAIRVYHRTGTRTKALWLPSHLAVIMSGVPSRQPQTGIPHLPP